MQSFVASYGDNSQAVYDPLIGLDQPDNGGSDLLRNIILERSTALWDMQLRIDMFFQLFEQIGNAITFSWIAALQSANVQEEILTDEALSLQRTKNQAAIQLLREWMDDDSGYDERTWPLVKKVIEENRISYRARFSD